MAITPVSNANLAPPASGSPEDFDAALQNALLNGGGSLLVQEMMKIANEVLSEALSDDE